MLSLIFDQELSSSAPDAAQWRRRWWTETKPKDAFKNFGNPGLTNNLAMELYVFKLCKENIPVEASLATYANLKRPVLDVEYPAAHCM